MQYLTFFRADEYQPSSTFINPHQHIIPIFVEIIILQVGVKISFAQILYKCLSLNTDNQ